MQKKKIMIIEDEQELVLILGCRLEANNFDIISATSAEEALEKINKEVPDLILLDVMLPYMDGFKMCRKLKNDSRYSKIPIIILSARAHDLYKKMGKEAGADDYITKPFDSNLLIERINRLIKS